MQWINGLTSVIFCLLVVQIDFCRGISSFSEKSRKEIKSKSILSATVFYKHSAKFKKIIIKLSQKKARPPLGEALPSLVLLPGDRGRILMIVELWGFVASKNI